LAMLVVAGKLIGVKGLSARDLFGAISASAAQWLADLTRGLRIWRVT
jgi:hypothetical protein